mgnify:CR=1 FL=1
MKLDFTSRPIAVIGDVILDCYIHGSADRLSPEAPVPVVDINGSSITYSLGGAGNVAANIKSLGGEPVLIGVIGGENPEFEVHRLLKEAGMITHGVLHVTERTTTIKTRLIANGHQIARMDRETTDPIDIEIENSTFNYVRRAVQEGVAALIISDYAKGVITHGLATRIIELAMQYRLPVFVDPKIPHRDYYRNHGITVMTPNIHEATALIGNVATEVDAIGRRILYLYNHEYCLITRGEDGMVLFDANAGVLGDPFKEFSSHHLPAQARHVFDVSGAGDTVIAALTLAFASGYSMLESAKIANLAAGVVVGKPGTAICTRKELEEIYET